MGSLISFSIEGMHPLDIGTMLNLKNIAVRTGHLCSQPSMAKYNKTQVTRISFGIYNSLEDIETFSKNLSTIIEKLR